MWQEENSVSAQQLFFQNQIIWFLERNVNVLIRNVEFFYKILK